jgi:glycosyltransferase involved in cell wall biosynthesis
VTDPMRAGDLETDLVGLPADTAHVVMLTGNNFVVDPRALKTAMVLANWDLRVTAIGLPARGIRGEHQIGKVRLVCPVIPQRALLTGFRHRIDLLRPWFATQAEYKRALGRWEYGTRELRGERGRDVRDQLRYGGRLRRNFSDRLRRAAQWRWLRLERVVLNARARPLRRRQQTRWGIGTRRRLAVDAYRRSPLAQWRWVLPEIIDQDLVLGSMLDQLRPDVLHVHDVFMLGIASRAAHRAAIDGYLMKIIYDAHEYLPGIAAVPPRRVAAYCDLEKEFIHDADRVVTVSEPLAEWLRRDHDLERLPDVVLNAPVESPADAEVTSIRDMVGVPADVPLVVYGGGVNPARGLHTIVRALPALPGVYFAIVSRGNYVTEELLKLAGQLGIGERVRLAPYVDPEFVPRYIESASVGISPLLRAPNHDIAITNKFCEYIAAGLPIVTSDTPAQAQLVQALDLGVVYRAGDVSDCARAIRLALADRDRLTNRIISDAALRHRFSWAAQAETLRMVYEELLGELPPRAWDPGATSIDRLISDQFEEDET